LRHSFVEAQVFPGHSAGGKSFFEATPDLPTIQAVDGHPSSSRIYLSFGERHVPEMRFDKVPSFSLQSIQQPVPAAVADLLGTESGRSGDGAENGALMSECRSSPRSAIASLNALKPVEDGAAAFGFPRLRTEILVASGGLIFNRQGRYDS
jgi:hypothetical protein